MVLPPTCSSGYHSRELLEHFIRSKKVLVLLVSYVCSGDFDLTRDKKAINC
jgi:hypothetical protein